MSFYIATTSKPILKRELQAAHVPTSGFQEFKAFPATEKKEQTDEDGKGDDSLDSIVDSIGFPMIVKPSISYASINISLSSVVHNRQELVEQVKQSLATCSIGSDSLESNSDIEESNNEEDRYRHETEAEGLERRVRGWEKEILRPTVFVERFLAGREFTVLVVGDRHWGVTVYPAAERVFKPSLGKYERLLAFEQYWEGCGLDWKEDNTEDYCRYQLADETWQKSLQQVAKDAFLAVHGSGYGRDTTSMANILLMTETSPRQFLYNLVDHALCRNRRLNGGEKETNRLVQIQDCSHESTGLHTKQKPLVLGGESTADLASELEFTLDRVQAEVDDIQRQIELEVRSCRERTESVELLVQS
ncbi:hypothetical protein BGW38_003882 [Lunasporangiospora selenospora]|uniref:ATP-grasp domain-containing protein n=1 Tax=Lunasporangiospora selenospora TaxID=979761 RepID=A0A9P6FS53_9FUNG|nr:hypothetical protein BGW38_003882 [Lunasporangiospora selenospora]